MSKVDRKGAVQKLKTLVLTPRGDVEAYREKIEDVFFTPFLPNKVERQEKDYSGVKCDYLIPEVYSSRRILIYVHGGSFVGGSRDSWRNFCASLANAASCRVVVPEFRVPPTHPYPASIEDVLTVFRMVHAEEDVALRLEDDDPGSLPQILLAADGSGASILMGVLQNMGEKYRKCVRTVVLFSPWLNLSSDCELIAGRKVRDEVIGGEDLHRAVDLYTYAANIENPLVSPLMAPAEKFAGFPPFYIQLGEKEILVQQVRQLAQKLEDAGVEYELDIWPEMMYMFQMADEFLPEAHLAVEKVGKYIRRREDLTQEEKDEREKILRKNDIVVD